MDGIQWYDLGSCRNSNLRNCKLTQKQLQGFNGTQTQGVSVRASVLCQLSYEDPYIETLTLGALALSSTSAVCNKINLYMSRVLPGLSKLCSKCMAWLLRNSVCPITSRYSCNSATWFVGRQVWTWVEQRAASLFNSFCSNVENQVARFCGAFYLTFTQCKMHHLNECHMLIIHRKGKERKISQAVYSNFSYSSVTRWF